MHKLILFIKSFKPDFERAKNLIESINKYNKDHIPVFISVNDEDFDFFKSKLSASINLIKDTDIATCSQIKDGWRYQQIIKAQVHKLNICHNYVCLDSDSEFIKDFYISDYMYDDDTPYTLMHESKDMLEFMEIVGRDSSNAFYKKALRVLRNFWGGAGKEWDYGPSPFIWSTQVWKHFESNFLMPNNYTFENFFKFLEVYGKTPPSEYTIYGEYLFKTHIIDIIPIQPLFKVYHFKEQYLLESKFNTTEKLKKNYLGIIKQSNWGKKEHRLTLRAKFRLMLLRVLLQK